MKAMIVRILLALAVLAGVVGAPAPARAEQFRQTLPPDPQPLPRTGDCVVDNIFYGTVPPGGDDAPVLVFVHGLSGLALDWWTDQTYAGLNEMYARAYNAGYRTAFVNLNVDDNTPPSCAVERRPANDNYVNGAVLAQQLDAITEHYAVTKVDIIAHSKGGIDAQTAIVWSGAYDKVRSLFTMGTPHQGSILVDQLWSPEGTWLAGLLGQLDDATYSMQTPVMQQFRSVTDPMTNDDGVDYYTGAGNYWDVRGLPILRLTGNWLQNHPDGGDNDAVVTVNSTDLPGASSLFLEPWTHIELYMGQNSFERIKPYLPVNLNAPATVAINGPAIGVVNRDYTFTATTTPGYVSVPLTYTWQATDLATLEVVGGISDARTLRWQRPGLKGVKVTVANPAGTVSTTQYLYVYPNTGQIRVVQLPLVLYQAPRSAAPRVPSSTGDAAPPVSVSSVDGPPASALLSQIARGGLLGDSAVETIPIEPQAAAANVMLLASDETVTPSLRAPDGTVYSLEPVSTEGAVLFEGAAAWQADLPHPQPGNWQLLLDGPAGAAYYALVTLDSSLDVALTGFPGTALSANQSIRLHASVQDGDQARVDAVTLTTTDEGRGMDESQRSVVSAAGATLDVRASGLSGVHGATVRIVGETADGYAFERTYSRSLMVAVPGEPANGP
ncbi:MAG: hypothetical protein R2844_04585 [Caldilineales bacterium]